MLYSCSLPPEKPLVLVENNGCAQHMQVLFRCLPHEISGFFLQKPMMRGVVTQFSLEGAR